MATGVFSPHFFNTIYSIHSKYEGHLGGRGDRLGLMDELIGLEEREGGKKDSE